MAEWNPIGGWEVVVPIFPVITDEGNVVWFRHSTADGGVIFARLVMNENNRLEAAAAIRARSAKGDGNG